MKFVPRKHWPIIMGPGLAVFMAWVAFAPHEPTFGGKSLAGWLELAHQTREIGDPFSDEEINTPSAEAIRAIGSNALPVLLRMARTRDTPLRRRLVQFSQNNDWVRWQPQSFDDIQMNAAYGFMVLGAAAEEAVPDLIAMLNDQEPEVRGMAAFALGRIGPSASNAIPALQQRLQQAKDPLATAGRQHDDLFLVTFALGRMGQAALSCMPLLADLQAHPNSLVREAARAACIRIGGNRQDLDPILQSLKDQSNQTNWLHAVRTISWTGTNGAPAIPDLIAALQNTNREIQGNALEALGRIHRRPEICVPALLELWQLSCSNGAPNGAILQTIGRFGPDARSFVSSITFVEALSDSHEFVRQCASNALREIDPQAALRSGIK